MHNMVRPKKCRRVNFEPGVTYFKPRGVPLAELEEVEIGYDELEALRLSNIDKLSQIDAAEKMGVHQSTFQRVLTSAREKITDSLVNGKAVKINGGAYKMPNKDGTGPDGEGPRTGRGLGNCPRIGNGTGSDNTAETGRCGRQGRGRGRTIRGE